MPTDASEGLRAELQRLDLLLHRQILRMRAAYELSLDEFRGLYISDEQVDLLVNQSAAAQPDAPSVADLTEKAEALRRAHDADAVAETPAARLASEFALTGFERDVVTLALAPEVDLKYETLYAYLNNNVTRKFPTVDLAVRLFAESPEERARLRRHLLPAATLFREGLLRPAPDEGAGPHGLASGFTLAPPVVQYLLALPHFEARLAHAVTQQEPRTEWADLPLAPARREELARILNLFAPSAGPPPVLVFEGRYGSGRALAAEAVCRALGRGLLRVDLDAWRAAQGAPAELVRELALQQRLRPAGVYFEPWAMSDAEGHLVADARALAGALGQLRGPVILAVEAGSNWPELLKGRRHLAFDFADPDYGERRRLWEWYAARGGSSLDAAAAEPLAAHFVLTPGQIENAVTAVMDGHGLRGERPAALDPAALFDAARAQSYHSLGRLAVKVETSATWDDLVLPRATLRQVREVSGAIRSRHVVYAEWGFGRRVATGRGLKVLFSGASGTGKTMAAGVIARDLRLDLYKIDLSGVVSKYIGETEKNLDRIFRAAQSSNAVLFFDEADALFGKRSEVKDAHDRYANIEVAYLLQKMEEHEGAVILATNLSKNIDKAFSRRMHYVVEFPMPDEAHRELLWRGMFPPQAPLAPDVDLAFLAQQFPLAGGDIRNVALDAAFLAARDGRVITMRQLVRAMARQMLKQGRSPSLNDFKQYHPLLAQDWSGRPDDL